MVWIDGVNYKSLKFTMLEKELKERRKRRTFRTNFIPKYRIDEIIAIMFSDKNSEEDKFLYFAKVQEIYPKMIKEVNLKEAKEDGFRTLKAFKNAICEINNIKDAKRFEQIGIFTVFEPMEDDYRPEIHTSLVAGQMTLNNFV